MPVMHGDPNDDDFVMDDLDAIAAAAAELDGNRPRRPNPLTIIQVKNPAKNVDGGGGGGLPGGGGWNRWASRQGLFLDTWLGSRRDSHFDHVTRRCIYSQRMSRLCEWQRYGIIFQMSASVLKGGHFGLFEREPLAPQKVKSVPFVCDFVKMCRCDQRATKKVSKNKPCTRPRQLCVTAVAGLALCMCMAGVLSWKLGSSSASSSSTGGTTYCPSPGSCFEDVAGAAYFLLGNRDVNNQKWTKNFDDISKSTTHSQSHSLNPFSLGGKTTLGGFATRKSSSNVEDL